MLLSKNIVATDGSFVYSSKPFHYTVYGTSGNDNRRKDSPVLDGLFTSQSIDLSLYLNAQPLAQIIWRESTG